MKKISAILTLALAAWAVRAALPQPDLIAQIHFAGGDQISAGQNYSAFTNEFSSAEARALRTQVADRLAPWLAGWLQVKTGAAAQTGAENLRPLFDDLQNCEWFFEARAAAGRPAGFLAVKLEPARRQFWKANLKSLPFEISDSRGWLFCWFGDAAGKLGNLPPPAPMNGWLTLDVNWPRLAQWYPKLKSLGLPETAFTVSAGNASLQINGKFYFPENLSLKLAAWQFPSNDVHQPLTSFTAVRGFAPWLAGQDWARAWQVSPAVNELFTWSMNGVPFQSFAAAPVADPAGALNRLYDNLQPVVANGNAHDRFVAPFNLSLADNRMTLLGMPIIAPEIKATNGTAGNFLVAGAFPNSPRSRPLPPELFRSLAPPNLVFYHWEITASRLAAQLQMGQLTLMLTRHKQLDGESAAFKWMQKTGAPLGNTVTEITQAAPDQLNFTRSAPGGLTAFELFALASWLDAPDFPHCNLELPPLSERLKKIRALRLQNHAAPPTSNPPALPQ